MQNTKTLRTTGKRYLSQSVSSRYIRPLPDKDGNKELEAGKDVTIIDTVTLEGLEIGTQYKLVGWQMLKEENAELLINGKRVESDYTFTADSKTMKVEVAFHVLRYFS